MLADKIKVAYPVLLVVTGLLISLLPGLPKIHIEPELIFIIFLPPLLYDAAFAMSWKELWRWRRIVTSFAFIVVFFTALSVAFVADWFIPGFSLALGFLLGGIVSPPDAISAGAILKFVKVPKRMSSILEGESLLNDASSLIIFRFALIAATTGRFVWQEAALSFGWIEGAAIRQIPAQCQYGHCADFGHAVCNVHCGGRSPQFRGIGRGQRRFAFVKPKASFSKQFVSVKGRKCVAKPGISAERMGLFIDWTGFARNQRGIKKGRDRTLRSHRLRFIDHIRIDIVRTLASYGAVVVTQIAGRFIQVADRKSRVGKLPSY